MVPYGSSQLRHLHTFSFIRQKHYTSLQATDTISHSSLKNEVPKLSVDFS